MSPDPHLGGFGENKELSLDQKHHWCFSVCEGDSGEGALVLRSTTQGNEKTCFYSITMFILVCCDGWKAVRHYCGVFCVVVGKCE